MRDRTPAGPERCLLPFGEDINGEKWKWVLNTEQRWAVSDLGRVCSVARTVIDKNGVATRYPARMLAQVPNVGGYLVVSVTINGKKTCRTVHSLVAEAFIGHRPSDLLVLHKNGCKLENRATNLYYGTQKQNMRDAVAHGTKPRGATHGMVKLTESEVSSIRSLKGAMKQRDIAHKFGVGQSQVQRILSGQSWAHVDGAK